MPATIPSKSLILKRQACKGTASNAKDKPALGAKNDLCNKKRLKGLAAMSIADGLFLTCNVAKTL